MNRQAQVTELQERKKQIILEYHTFPQFELFLYLSAEARVSKLMNAKVVIANFMFPRKFKFARMALVLALASVSSQVDPYGYVETGP